MCILLKTATNISSYEIAKKCCHGFVMLMWQIPYLEQMQFLLSMTEYLDYVIR